MLLAAVRRARAWAYLSGGAGRVGGDTGHASTLVYAYRSAGRPGACVGFWDARSGERRVRIVRRLLAIQVLLANHCMVAGLNSFSASATHCSRKWLNSCGILAFPAVRQCLHTLQMW